MNDLEKDFAVHEAICAQRHESIGKSLSVTDSAFIPFDPANTDYQAYLEWFAEGNTPEPADE